MSAGISAASAALIGGGLAAAGGIAGSIIGGNAAQSAADTQAQAAQQAAQAQQQSAQQAIQAQLQMFGQGQQNIQPWLQTGQLALSDLRSFMGLGDIPSGMIPGGVPASAAGSPYVTPSGIPDPYYTGPNAVQPGQAGGLPTRYGPAIPSGGVAGTGVGGSMTAPGVSMYGPQYPGYQPFQYDPSKDPLRAFMLQQGSEAIANQRSALGGVGSGTTLKALSDYGQATAAQSYQQEFGNYQAEQAAKQQSYQQEFQNWNTQLNNIFSRLSGISGVGASAASGVAGLGTQVGQSIGGNIIGSGQAAGAGIMGAGLAQSAGQVGAANALTGGIQGFFASPSWTNLITPPAGSTISPLGMGMANLSSDPLGALISQQGWSPGGA